MISHWINLTIWGELKKSNQRGMPMRNRKSKVFHVVIAASETAWATVVSDVASGCAGLS